MRRDVHPTTTRVLTPAGRFVGRGPTPVRHDATEGPR
jgi:hypothetical protein